MLKKPRVRSPFTTGLQHVFFGVGTARGSPRVGRTRVPATAVCRHHVQGVRRGRLGGLPSRKAAFSQVPTRWRAPGTSGHAFP
eukprot:4021913-Prymnesium_polylepis.1